MAAPILKIDDLAFELEQGFSDGYANRIKPVSNLNFRSHPSNFIWWGGEFKPLNIAINLAVGVQSILGDSFRLVNAVEYLVRKALPQKSIGATPQTVTVSVGTWFRRVGYISNIDVEFQEPWDVNTGQPMRAAVKFTLIADFLVKKGAKNLSELPNSINWNFKYVGTGNPGISSGKFRSQKKAPNSETGGS